MSEIVFTRGHRPLNEERLVEFEDWLKARLPDAYRNFLLRQNGGHPHKHLLSDCYLEAFYGITDSNANMSLKCNVDLVAGDLPSSLIAIGYAGNGDRICLSLEDDQIYLWEHEVEFDGVVAKSEGLVPIAKNIDELLTKLEGDDPPVPDEEVDNIGRWGDEGLLEEFLAKGHDINEVTSSGRSLVRSAAWALQLEFLKECVRRGAELNGRGLLHATAVTRDVVMAEYLLDQGVDPNEKNERNKTPLDSAISPKVNRVVPLIEGRGGVRTKERV